MHIESRCREYREGRVGRYHTYTCRRCGHKFRVFLTPGNTLSQQYRVCLTCEPACIYDVIPVRG